MIEPRFKVCACAHRRIELELIESPAGRIGARCEVHFDRTRGSLRLELVMFGDSSYTKQEFPEFPCRDGHFSITANRAPSLLHQRQRRIVSLELRRIWAVEVDSLSIGGRLEGRRRRSICETIGAAESAAGSASAAAGMEQQVVKFPCGQGRIVLQSGRLPARRRVCHDLVHHFGLLQQRQKRLYIGRRQIAAVSSQLRHRRGGCQRSQDGHDPWIFQNDAGMRQGRFNDQRVPLAANAGESRKNKRGRYDTFGTMRAVAVVPLCVRCQSTVL